MSLCLALFAVLLMDSALFIPPQALAANVITHVTTGSVKIKGQDLPGAKQKAVKQALAKSVEQAVAQLVSRDVFASNLEFLYSRILPLTQDYVVTYRVMAGMTYSDRYLVGVESKINQTRLEEQLKIAGLIKTVTDRPVVLMLIAEESLDASRARNWWTGDTGPYASTVEAIIKAMLQQKRILFARRDTTYPNPTSYNINFTSTYDTQAAMDLGRALKADLVVLGRASTSESGNRMGDQRAFDANIDLIVFDINSQAQVIHTTAKSTAKSHMEYEGTTQALEAAAEKAGMDLAQKIDTFWSRTLRQKKQFDLTVEGDNFLTRFITLKRRMRDIRDIENMQPKEIGARHAVMRMTFKGSSSQFANALLLKTFEGFGLEILEVTDDQVKIRFTAPTVLGDEQIANPTPITQEKIEN